MAKIPEINHNPLQVTIPNVLGGIIIGKGGERINQIRAESGARVDLDAARGKCFLASLL